MAKLPVDWFKGLLTITELIFGRKKEGFLLLFWGLGGVGGVKLHSKFFLV